MNRAPALGHRLEVDRTIKTTLTRDAWTLAMALMPQQPLEPTARKVSTAVCPLGHTHRAIYSVPPRSACTVAKDRRVVLSLDAPLW